MVEMKEEVEQVAEMGEETGREGGDKSDNEGRDRSNEGSSVHTLKGGHGIRLYRGDALSERDESSSALYRSAAVHRPRRASSHVACP